MRYCDTFQPNSSSDRLTTGGVNRDPIKCGTKFVMGYSKSSRHFDNGLILANKSILWHKPEGLTRIKLFANYPISFLHSCGTLKFGERWSLYRAITSNSTGIHVWLQARNKILPCNMVFTPLLFRNIGVYETSCAKESSCEKFQLKSHGRFKLIAANKPIDQR